MADDDDTRRNRKGIPLEELRRHQERLRAEAIPAPVEPESETTGRIGTALFQRLQRDDDAPVDVDALVDRFADRLARRAGRETERGTKRDAKRATIHEWSRTAAAVIAIGGMLFGAWIGLRDEVRARPTSGDIDRQLEPLRVKAAAQDAEQRAQRDVMIELTEAVKGLTRSVDRLEAAPPPARRGR